VTFSPEFCVPETEITGMASFARFVDPAGNIVRLVNKDEEQYQPTESADLMMNGTGPNQQRLH